MNLHFSDVAKDEALKHYPEEVRALARYLKQNKTGICGKEGTYRFRVRIAKARNLSARRYEFGLKTSNLAEAVKRAGELVSLFHFFGWIVASRQINAPALASLFPLSDLSDDLGRDRDDEEITEFAGGNAGCPFFIQWANDAPATGKRKSPGELRGMPPS